MVTRIAITPGEPAGIGPDLCVLIARQPPANTELVIVGDGALLGERATMLDLPLTLKPFDPARPARASLAGELALVQVNLRESAVAGVLNPANAVYVLDSLREAANRVMAGEMHAMVTGPAHKGVINDGGFDFPGHTEFLAAHCECELTVMMLATEGLRVALATTHLPLKEVPGALTRERLEAVLRILHDELTSKFRILSPTILVCGLNPHAGERGHLGREEIEIIEPVVKALRAAGMNLRGPLPADTLFTPRYLHEADAVLAMYHDQGLPVLKFKGFGKATNITLGLPLIRTSVDHGTALDLAGSGQVSTGSLYHAIATATEMVACRNEP